MPDRIVALHGPGASLDYRAGPVVARVRVGECEVDPERDRCRVDSIPAPDLDRWVSGSGVLLLGRLRLWGVELVEDRLPVPRVESGAAAGDRRPRRPYLPRDLASCPCCRSLVVLERDREGPGFRLARPTSRLARRAEVVLQAGGLMPFVAGCSGRGRKAGRPHARDCYALPGFRPFGAGKPKSKRSKARKGGGG